MAEREHIAAITRSTGSYQMKMKALREAAVARGGKPLRNIPGKYRPDLSALEAVDMGDGAAFLEGVRRKPGEIVNPVTGEIVEGCLSLGKSAAALGITTQRLSKLMERVGIVHRVLSWKDIPMLANPALRRPQYFETPVAIPSAIAGGFLIPIPMRERGAVSEMILVTPKGLAMLEDELRKEKAAEARPPTRPEARRRTVHRLFQQGRSQSEIVRKTGIPKQTVSRIVGQIKSAA